MSSSVTLKRPNLPNLLHIHSESFAFYIIVLLTNFILSPTSYPIAINKEVSKRCKGNNATHDQCHAGQQHDTATRYSGEFQLFILHSDASFFPA